MTTNPILDTIQSMGKTIQIQLLKHAGSRVLSEGATAYANAFNNAGVGENWEQEATEKYFMYCLKRQEDLVFVVLINGKVVGGVMGEIRRLSSEYLFITDLFVDPKYQGKGIAKELLKKLFQATKQRYPDVETVDTLADSTKVFPIGWYDRLGMHTTGWTHISGSFKEVLATSII